MKDRVVWAIAVAYAALYTALGVVKYDAHRNFVDFGIFAQTSASAFGCFCNTVEGSHWAVHFSPILYLAGAALAALHSPYTLVALQAIAGALVIPPVAAMAGDSTGYPIARLTALVAFLYPPLGGAVFNDFHENAFAPAAVAWMIWAFYSGYLRSALLFAALALAVKEDQAVFLAIAGALGWWRHRGTSHGRVCAIVALVSIAVAKWFFFGIQAHASHDPHWSPVRFYAWTLDDVRELVPSGALERAGFIVLAFAPLAFVPFRSRLMWLAGAPLAEVLLSRMSTTYTLGSHYAGAWAGYVLAAFAFGVRDLAPGHRRRVLYACVAVCAIELLVANPLHPGLNLHAPQARDERLDHFLATVPRDAPVATQEEAYTHLALSHPAATVFPDSPLQPLGSCYILIDREFPQSPRLQEYGPAIERLLAPPSQYVLERSENTIALYRNRRCSR